jgi:hypothetical protein
MDQNSINYFLLGPDMRKIWMKSSNSDLLPDPGKFPGEWPITA